ncbi:MAG: hypothetical protein IPM25_00705 [Chloracidobacterium sp.]|nr:hypothetical protein [Chloracidobacterium sp.]
MFRFGRNTENANILSLQLTSPADEKERPIIIRNRRPETRPTLRKDLYRRADGFLIRYRLNQRLSI